MRYTINLPLKYMSKRDTKSKHQHQKLHLLTNVSAGSEHDASDWPIFAKTNDVGEELHRSTTESRLYNNSALGCLGSG